MLGDGLPDRLPGLARLCLAAGQLQRARLLDEGVALRFQRDGAVEMRQRRIDLAVGTGLSGGEQQQIGRASCRERV